MTNVTLKLSLDEVNSILNVLGELPSKTGAWPLMLRIKQQADSQAAEELPEAEIEK